MALTSLGNRLFKVCNIKRAPSGALRPTLRIEKFFKKIEAASIGERITNVFENVISFLYTLKWCFIRIRKFDMSTDDRKASSYGTL